jgi:hypothetical protein
MDEELQKKMDTYNEMLLKNTALTFSSEGVTNDIKVFLSRKAVFVTEMLNGLAAIIEAAARGKVSAARQKVFDQMLELALNECRMVSSTMNYVIAKTFEREMSFLPPNPQGQKIEEPSKKPKGKGRKA